MRDKQEIVDEAYELFCLSYDKFKKDTKRFSGNFHFDWVGKVAEISEKILINERISAESKSRYESKQKRQKDDLITIICRDGAVKTKDVNSELKKENFKYNSKSYFWYRNMKPSSWDYLKDRYPFIELKCEVVKK